MLQFLWLVWKQPFLLQAKHGKLGSALKQAFSVQHVMTFYRAVNPPLAAVIRNHYRELLQLASQRPGVDLEPEVSFVRLATAVQRELHALALYGNGKFDK